MIRASFPFADKSNIKGLRQRSSNENKILQHPHDPCVNRLLYMASDFQAAYMPPQVSDALITEEGSVPSLRC